MFDSRLLDYVRSAVLSQIIGVVRNGKLNLAGSAGPNGGQGQPPGGFDRQLIQSAITYDTSEASYSSGSSSLVDNLAHLRFLIGSGGGISDIGFYSGTTSGSTFIGSGSNIAVDSNFTVSMNGKTGLINTAPHFLVASTVTTGSFYGARYLEVGGSGLSLWGSGGLWGTGWVWGGNSGSDVVAKFNGAIDIDSDRMRLRQSRTPSGSGAPGLQGEIAWDSSWLYVCIAPSHWRRTSLSDW